MMRVGQLYATGLGCAVDAARAAVWFKKAHAAGNDIASSLLDAVVAERVVLPTEE